MLKPDSRNIIVNMTLQQIAKSFSDIHSKNKACYKKSLKKKKEKWTQFSVTYYSQGLYSQAVCRCFIPMTDTGTFLISHSWYPYHALRTTRGLHISPRTIYDRTTHRGRRNSKKILLRTLMSNCESRLSVSMFRCDYWGDKDSDPTLSSPTRTNLITKQM